MTIKQLADLNRRLVMSSLVGAAVASLIIFSSHPIVSWMLMGVVAVIAAIGVWEYAQLSVAK